MNSEHVSSTPKQSYHSRGSQQSCGLDLYAFLLTDEGRPNNIMLPPNMTRPVRTGIGVDCPRGYFGVICSRSGIARSNSIFVANSPGVIDPDYQGELSVLLYNGSHMPFYVKHHDRIGQLIVLPFTPASVREVG